MKPGRNCVRAAGIPAALWLASFLVYQTTFLCTPRLFLFPEAGLAIADIPEYATALRGRPNEEDMRKHLLYYPLGRPLYLLANRARLRLGINHDAAALAFPGALCGATSVVLAYYLFFRILKGRKRAAAASAFYAFTYSVWVFASVPESYALTTVSVNLFLCLALAENSKRDRYWLCGMVALICFSSLLDLRSLFLLLVPLYLIAGTPGMSRLRRIGAAFFVTLGTLCLVAAAYQVYSAVSGYSSFSVHSMYEWIRGLGGVERSVFVEGASFPVSSAGVLSTFFIESISPFYRSSMAESSATVNAVHLAFAFFFLALFMVLVFGALVRIAGCILSSPCLQALACWLAVYTAFHAFYSPWSAGRLNFSNPVVFPVLLLTMPGIVGAWRLRRFGVPLMSAIVVVILANNLVVINGARSAWQMPDIVQTAADRVYLLHGEIGRLRYLARKGTSTLPEWERRRMYELGAKHPGSLTESDRRELDELVMKGLERLPGEERDEALDILQRYNAVVRLAADSEQRRKN